MNLKKKKKIIVEIWSGERRIKQTDLEGKNLGVERETFCQADVICH